MYMVHQLQILKQLKDLRVVLDSKLFFKEHIDYIINKAKQISGFVKRHTNEINLRTVKILYTSLICTPRIC